MMQRPDEQVYNFILDLEGVDISEPERLEALYEAGCDDATFGADSGHPVAIFHRRARSLPSAVGTAISAVESAVPGLFVRAVTAEWDLVTISQIAQRTGRTRESIRQLATGKRGPGDFPRPVYSAGGHDVYAWHAVWNWLLMRKGEFVAPEPFKMSDGEFLAALNAALEFRRWARRELDPEAREVLKSLIQPGVSAPGASSVIT